MAAASPLPLLGAADILRRPSLYVGDLDAETTEKDLVESFSRFGALDSVRLCTDTVTKRSLCYAYVNFLSFSDALKAMTCLNHTYLRGKPIRIMWCQRDPLARKSGVGNLFVKNLAPSVTSAQLERIFSHYGTIISCKVVVEDGKSKCFGFVQFESEHSAMFALRHLNGAMFEGKKLYVSKFMKKKEREVQCEDLKFTNVYVKNFDDDLTEELLRGTFSKYGKVQNVIIIRDKNGKSRGSGFVNFCSHEDAQRAIECMNGALLGSKQLIVVRAQKKDERNDVSRCIYDAKFSLYDHKPEVSNLYVKNLSLSLDERKLKALFSAYGEVKSAKIMRRDDGVSKGFGFVSFSNPRDAKRAMEYLNGTTCDGMCLQVALAWSKEENTRGSSYAPPRKPLPFSSPNQDIVMPTLQEFLYHIPPYSMSTPEFNPYKSTTSLTYQPISRQMGTFFPVRMCTYRGGNDFKYIPDKNQPQQSPTDKHSFCSYKVAKYDAPMDGSEKLGNQMEGSENLGNQMNPKVYGKQEIPNANEVEDSVSDLALTTTKSMMQLMIDLEHGHAAEINKMLSEGNRSMIQKMMSLPDSLVANIEEAVNTVKAKISIP
ncbi:unnamed protein product [Cuscuta epithymum]|uniref:RRM domain-containing protein n=1 Tax=Cuscuta epithymum TaxID=186058 RepID=A0AAV0D518_9ASTE|nr:unnamed protein product [Cuscuta epithymum]